MTLEERLRDAISKGDEFEFLNETSMTLRNVPINKQEMELYNNNRKMYDHYYGGDILPKYMAGQDLIDYFNSNLLVNNKN